MQSSWILKDVIALNLVWNLLSISNGRWGFLSGYKFWKVENLKNFLFLNVEAMENGGIIHMLNKKKNFKQYEVQVLNFSECLEGIRLTLESRCILAIWIDRTIKHNKKIIHPKNQVNSRSIIILSVHIYFKIIDILFWKLYVIS